MHQFDLGSESPRKKPGPVKTVDPDKFCTTVSEFLQENPDVDAVKLRIFGTKTVGRQKRRKDPSKLLVTLSWAPSEDGDGDAWWLEDFLIDAPETERALSFDTCYAIEASPPQRSPIARTMLDFSSGEEESPRAKRNNPESVADEITKTVQGQMAQMVREQFGLSRPKKRSSDDPDYGTLTRLPNGMLADIETLRDLYQRRDSDVEDLRRQMEELRKQNEEKEKKAGGIFGEAGTEILKTVIDVGGSWLKQRFGGEAEHEDAEESDEAIDPEEVLNYFRQNANHAASQHTPTNQFRTVAGPSVPPPTAPAPPPQLEPRQGNSSIYDSPLANLQPRQTPTPQGQSGNALHDLFGGGTVEGPPMKLGPAPLEERMKVVAQALSDKITGIYETFGTAGVVLKWSKFKREAKEGALEVFGPACEAADIPVTEMRVALTKPKSITDMILRVVPPATKKQLGELGLKYVREIVLEMITETDWDDYFADAR